MDAPPARQGMLAINPWRGAVTGQPCGPAPDDDMTMAQPVALGAVAAARRVKQNHCGQAQRHRNNPCLKVFLVLVLMQREPGAGRLKLAFQILLPPYPANFKHQIGIQSSKNGHKQLFY